MQHSLELIRFTGTSSGNMYVINNMHQGPFPSGEWQGLYLI